MTEAQAEKEEDDSHAEELAVPRGEKSRERGKWLSLLEESEERVRRSTGDDRERVDVFLTTEKGNESKETERVTVFKEKYCQKSI